MSQAAEQDATWSLRESLFLGFCAVFIILTLLIDGYVNVNSKTEILFTPSWEGILTMIAITFVGLWLNKYRIRNQRLGLNFKNSRPD